MKRTRRLLCFLLAVVFTAALLPAAAPAAAHALTPGGCTEAENGLHNWSPYDFAQYPTCTANGTYIYICLNCWATEIGPAGEIPATGHSWSGWDLAPGSLPPTCTDGSLNARFCLNCGAMETMPVSALGHAWDGGTVTAAAGCAAPGSLTYRCTRCGAEETHEIPAAGHSWSAWDTAPGSLPPTCTEGSLNARFCSNCGAMETMPVSALGHDWTEGSATEPQGLHDGIRTWTCRRCGETVTESVPLSPVVFFAALRDFPLEWESSGLHITQHPVGGFLSRDSGESLTLTVAAEGGVEPYTYEWHCEAIAGWLDDGDGSEDESTPVILNAAAAAGKELSEAYANVAVDWHGAHVGTFGDVFDPGRLSTVTEADGSRGSLLDALNVLDQKLGGSGDGPSYTATRGNCEYWVEITDAVGNRAISHAARVYYHLRIAEHPENANLQPEGKAEVSCLAADGLGRLNYTYRWVDMDGNDAGTGPTVELDRAGDYICIVSDTADVVSSEPCTVYDAEPFRIAGLSEPADELRPGEEWVVSAWCTGGVPPYEVLWDCEGTPLLTDQGSDIQGFPAFYAIGTDAGIYTVRATDSMGAVDTRTVCRRDRSLTITQQPVGGTLPPAGCVVLSVTADGGEEPYTYVLYRNGKANMRKTTNGVFEVWYPGEYSIRVEDSRDNHVVSDKVSVEIESFRITDCSDAAEITEYGEMVRLFIEVTGGRPPYTYEWLQNTIYGWFGGNPGPQTAYYARRPGTYACRVTDTYGNTLYREMEVGYSGDLPVIVLQPESGQISEGRSWWLMCDAISGSGDKSVLRYTWEQSPDGSSWHQLADGEQKLKTFDFGFYRCKVTDTGTGRYVYSNTVSVSENLELKVWHKSRYAGGPPDPREFVLSIQGGLPPYTCRISMLIDGQPVPCTEMTFEKGGYWPIKLPVDRDSPAVHTDALGNRTIRYEIYVRDTAGNSAYETTAMPVY